MSKIVECTNAVGQPRLVEGARYEVVLDVTHATVPGETRNRTGYVIKAEDDTMALPYVYRRDRFTDVSE